MISKFTNTTKTNALQNLLIGAILFFSTIALAQPGSIDPTFNTFDDGTFGDGSGFNSTVFSTAIQSDGKIILGGSFTSFNGTTGINRIVRLNTNGSIDPSFNTGTGFNDIVRSISIQSDGKIIVGGDFTSFNGTTGINRIVCLNADGSRDATFSSGTGFNDIVRKTSIQSDGKIIVGGNFTSFNGTTGINFIVRLNANGTRDVTFNTGTGFGNWVFSTSIQADGKVIVGGAFTSFNGTTGINRIIRLNADGSRDATFITGTGFGNWVYSTSIQTDGKVIVGGDFTSFNGTTGINRIVRLNADGTLDATFSTGTGFNDRIHSISIQADGKVIVGGAFNSFNGTTGINRIARLNADGSIDATFNTGTDFNGNIFSTSIQLDGKIIVGGAFSAINSLITERFRIARLNADGSKDVSFITGKGFNGTVWSTAIQSDGKIIFIGDFNSFNNTVASQIVRLNADGTIDGSFNTGTGVFPGLVRSISIQSDGKIIVGGSFSSFNGTTGLNCIVRLNTDGSIDPSFNTGMGFNNMVWAISIQSDGKIILGGDFTSFNNTAGTNRIARLNADGSVDATFNTGTGFNNYITSINIQSDGKIIVGGLFTSFNGTSGVNRIVRLNADGSLDASFNAGSGFDSNVQSTSIQSDGKIIVGGFFTFFNGTSGVNRIARLNTDGSLDATFNTGTGIDYGAWSTAIQSDGKIIVGGEFLSYNGTTGINRIVRLNTDGTRDANFNTGTGFNNTVYSTSIQSGGKIIVGGAFTSFNGTWKNRLLRLLGCAPTSGSQNVTVCNSYKWLANGTTYTTSGTYTATLTNAAGCDSTVTLNLTIKNSTTGTDVQSACNSYTWIDGNTYTSSNNTATHVLTNAAGCDSIVTLNLTIKNSNSGSQNITVCDSYKWLANGTTYTTSGTYTATLTNIAGCDSTATLNLTIKNSNSGSQNITTCNSYKWLANGTTYTASGTYTATLTNIAGCDSTATLNLTIKNSTTGTDVQSACDTYTWIDGNTYTSSNTTATHVLTNAAGCDSIVTLNLTINQTPVLTTSLNGVTITADETGANYQWINCANNTAINGETNQSYTATVNGNYAVVVTKNTCSDTSACVNITTVGISNISNITSQISIYPNPFSSTTTIRSNYALINATLTIANLYGQVVNQINNISGDTITINRNNLPNGGYFITLIENNNILSINKLLITDSQ